MFIAISWVIGTILLLSGIYSYNREKHQDDKVALSTVLYWVSGSLLFLGTLLLISSFINVDGTRQEYAEVRSFLESGIYTEYESIIQAQIDAGIIGDISNTTVGKDIAARIEGWYNKIEYINTRITKAQTMNGSFIYDCFCWDWPEYPPLIDAKKIRELRMKFNKKIENMNLAIPSITIP